MADTSPALGRRCQNLKIITQVLSQVRVTSGYVLVHSRLCVLAGCHGPQMRVQYDVMGRQLAQAGVTPSPVPELPKH